MIPVNVGLTHGLTKEQPVASGTENLIPIFDGHNDTIMKIRDGSTKFFEENEGGHIDLPRAKRGGLAGGFFAVWVPDQAVQVDPDDPNTSAYSDTSKLPPMMSTEWAQHYALSSLGLLLNLEKESNGAVKIVHTAAELQSTLESDTFAVELHLEGAEPIDEELNSLPVWYGAGVRSIGLVWSRSNRFAHGVPFKFGATPDTGPGLTDAGIALVKACNELGIMLDVSHLNEAGFWDIAKYSTKPIVATHSNAWAIAPSTRNLTDKQLDAVKDSDGVVGLNFHVGFLNRDGSTDAAATTVAIMADHATYLAEKLGIDRVALGSDYDGALMPGDLKDAAGLPLLIAELRNRGFDDAALRKIGYENWVRVLGKTWNA
jgi:membrane dipeptidase